jgi:hypothetical protein
MYTVIPTTRPIRPAIMFERTKDRIEDSGIGQ